MPSEDQTNGRLTEIIKVTCRDSEIGNGIQHDAVDKGIKCNTTCLNGNLRSREQPQPITELSEGSGMKRGQVSRFNKFFPATIFCEAPPGEKHKAKRWGLRNNGVSPITRRF